MNNIFVTNDEINNAIACDEKGSSMNADSIKAKALYSNCNKKYGNWYGKIILNVHCYILLIKRTQS